MSLAPTPDVYVILANARQVSIVSGAEAFSCKGIAGQ